MAQEENVWNVSLDSIVVSTHRNNSALRTRVDGSMQWSLSQLQLMPKLLGEADPLRYAQMLPGFQTNNEYHSGLVVQGCDNQHSVATVGGVPLYNVSHLMGFFSSFISSHYPSMSLDKSPSSSGFANRLGAELVMDLPDVPADSSSGDFTVGLISSQGTYRWRVSPSTALIVSLRASYMKYLYSHWLKADDQHFDYSFYDTSATLVHRVDSLNTLALDFYSGDDRCGLLENGYLADIHMTWGNVLGAVHWVHDSPRRGLKSSASLYVTSYRNRFDLALEGMDFKLRSRICDLGLKWQLSCKRLSAGVEAVRHWVQPQSLERVGTYNETTGLVQQQRSIEASVHADYAQPLSSAVTALVGLRGSAYRIDGHTFLGVDPIAAVHYDDKTWQMSLSYAHKHQYLFQTGFSDMGLPTEFWLSSSSLFKPQSADLVSLSVSRYLFNRGYQLVVDLFYKELYHQLEYVGNVLDFANKNYDLSESMIGGGRGRNYGFSVMVNKTSGRWNGWLGYTYLRAQRYFDDVLDGKPFAANHSRPHELNAVVNYRHNGHWDFGGCLVGASGTPYTAAQSLMMFNGNVLVNQGPHNGKRLNFYLRLDLSANYRWRTRLFDECGLNISIYNVTFHKNELFHYFKMRRRDDFIAYRPVSSVLRLLPSLSFFCKF